MSLGQGQEQEEEGTDVPSLDDGSDDPEIVGLCELLAAQILIADPKAKPAPDSVKWRRDMRLLVQRDGRTPDEVFAVIDYIFDEGFWVSMVLSPAALRRRFAQISVQMKRKPKSKIAHVSLPNPNQQAVLLAEYEQRVSGQATRRAGNTPTEENV